MKYNQTHISIIFILISHVICIYICYVCVSCTQGDQMTTHIQAKMYKIEVLVGLDGYSWLWKPSTSRLCVSIKKSRKYRDVRGTLMYVTISDGAVALGRTWALAKSQTSDVLAFCDSIALGADHAADQPHHNDDNINDDDDDDNNNNNDDDDDDNINDDDDDDANDDDDDDNDDDDNDDDDDDNNPARGVVSRASGTHALATPPVHPIDHDSDDNVIIHSYTVIYTYTYYYIQSYILIYIHLYTHIIILYTFT